MGAYISSFGRVCGFIDDGREITIASLQRTAKLLKHPGPDYGEMVIQIKTQEIAALHQQWKEHQESMHQEILALLQQWEKKEKSTLVLCCEHTKVFDKIKEQIAEQAKVGEKLKQVIQRNAMIIQQQQCDNALKKIKDEQIVLAEQKEALKEALERNKESNNNNGVGGDNNDDDHDDEREIQIQNQVIVALQQQWEDQKENKNKEIAALNQQWEEQKEKIDDIEIQNYFLLAQTELVKKIAAQEKVGLKLIKAIQRNTISVEKKLQEQLKLEKDNQKLVKSLEHLEPDVVTGALKDIEDSIEELLYDTDNTDLPGYPYKNLIECKTLPFIPILLFHGGGEDDDDDNGDDDDDDDVDDGDSDDEDVDDDDDDDNDYQLLFHTDDQKKKKLGLWGIDQDDDDDDDDDVSGNTNNVLEALTIFYLKK